MSNKNNVLVGTSGFSYPEWKGTFYPEDLPAKKFLSYYSGHFRTTEINNTFYRIPVPKTTEAWYGEVGADFCFTLKLSQKITHFKKLKDVSEEMERFLEAAEALKEKMGTVLVQLPRYFKKDADVLHDFLRHYSGRAKLAFEFRHESWYNDEVYGLLKQFQSALAVVEAEEQDAVREITAGFVYMRLRKGDYKAQELKAWAKWIDSLDTDVFCYLKHDQKAPLLAHQLLGFLNY